MIPDAYAVALRSSDYVGWVAYVDGHAIFEAVPNGVRLATPMAGGLTLPHRPSDRHTKDWKDVPRHRLDRLEVYWLRDAFPPDEQPIVQIDRPPDRRIRFIQFKQGGVLVPGGAATHRRRHELEEELSRAAGQRRTGILSWTVGYFDREKQKSELWKLVPANPNHAAQVFHAGPVRHPCWPRPGDGEPFNERRHGFGLARELIGKGG